MRDKGYNYEMPDWFRLTLHPNINVLADTDTTMVWVTHACLGSPPFFEGRLQSVQGEVAETSLFGKKVNTLLHPLEECYKSI